MPTALIIQARTGSTRLPQKMVLPFFDGKGIFEILLDRLMDARLNVPIILATTENQGDNILVEITEKKGIDVFRGSEENVLKRFIGAAEVFDVEKIIRVCADNPFLDIAALRFLIDEVSHSDTDYWGFAKKDGTPSIKTHYGFWAEGVKTEALRKVSDLTREKLYLEHVTNYVYSNPALFSIFLQPIQQEVQALNIRLTIDTLEDFKIAQEVYLKAEEKQIPLESLSLSAFVSQNKKWLEAMNTEIISNQK